MVLKKLIKEQLSPLAANLSSQSKSYGYNKNLSIDQKELIDRLEEAMLLFQGNEENDDEADSKKISEIIDGFRVKIQAAREKHGAARDEGATISCLNNLIFHTSGFHSKLVAFKFNLLNKPYSETPENIVYYHSAYYFGEEIFTPKSGIDLEIRVKKEQKLAIRLQSLSELIKPSHTLDQQRERAMQVLTDLANDNKMVIKKDEGATPVALPGLSFWGFSMTAPTDWFAASEGRMGQQFNFACRKIREMTKDTFQPGAEAKAEGPALEMK